MAQITQIREWSGAADSTDYADRTQMVESLVQQMRPIADGRNVTDGTEGRWLNIADPWWGSADGAET